MTNLVILIFFMIEIKNLKINVWEKEILRDINMTLETGKNYLILWKNGSWKSSLSSFLMWNPIYTHINWEVYIDGKNLLEMDIDARARAWLFLSFQNIPEIPGIQLGEYLRIIYNNYLKHASPETKPLSPFVFKRLVAKHIQELEINENFLLRDLNVWFSGGEKRKIEILQAKLLTPKYIILDEIDSWLDINAFQIVCEHIKKMSNENNSIIVITHHFKIVDYIDFNTVYVLKNWELHQTGKKDLVNEIIKNGFE